MKKIYYVKCEYSEKLTDVYFYEIDNEILQEDNFNYIVVHKLHGTRFIPKNDILTFSNFKESYYINKKEISCINFWDDENKRNDSFDIGFIYENEEDVNEMKKFAKELATKEYKNSVQYTIDELQHCLNWISK